jgi:hypothetical protein
MNYKIPLDFYGFFQKIELSNNKKQTHFDPVFQKVDKVKESIDEFIDLLVFTHPGECVFFHDFGFAFWESQFSNISIEHLNNSEYPKKEFEESLQRSISRYETRLEDVNVEVLLTNQDISPLVKKNTFSVVVSVTGKTKTFPGEPYHRTIIFASETMTRK